MKLKFVSLAVILVFSMTFSACEWSHKRQIVREGNELIAKIEAFKKDNGRLPETLMEIGKKREELEEPITYFKMSPTRYTLGALLSMNSSYNYDSDTKEWTRKP
jgi:phosphoribosylaminoimidazole-succinocarboxamide synthase